MKTKEIIIVGAGIAGCAAALALAKRGIGVTLMTSSYDKRIYHAPFIKHDRLEEKLKELQQGRQDNLYCSRANEQLTNLAKKSVDELLESNYMVDRNGNIDIHRCLEDQLKQFDNVEWIQNHFLIELITLDQHSLKKSDRYKKPACLGVLAYNPETNKIERFLAKETILATGGASSLYPYSSHLASACGQGLAIAHRAGVRLLNMDQFQFHPLGFFEKEGPCFPLPLELLNVGQLYIENTNLIDPVSGPEELSEQLYELLLANRRDHLWLDLTQTDPVALKEKFASTDAYCLAQGYNFTKDPLPVVPIANYTCGGIAVDRAGQTNLQRLRAIGEVSCTGLFNQDKEEALSVLESLTWAHACADDIAKQAGKLIYYFPELREDIGSLDPSSSIVTEDWDLLRRVMWSYVGIKRDRPRLERACKFLNDLHRANFLDDMSACTIEQIQLFYAIQTGRIVAHTALAQWTSINPGVDLEVFAFSK